MTDEVWPECSLSVSADVWLFRDVVRAFVNAAASLPEVRSSARRARLSLALRDGRTSEGDVDHADDRFVHYRDGRRVAVDQVRSARVWYPRP